MARKVIKNIKFTLPVSGADIEILPYETAITDQLNQSIYLSYGSLDMKQAMDDNKRELETGEKSDDNSAIKFENLPASAIMEIKNNAIRGFVVSIDGEKFGGDDQQILDEVLTLPKTDYDEIQAQIDKVKGDRNLDPKVETK